MISVDQLRFWSPHYPNIHIRIIYHYIFTNTVLLYMYYKYAMQPKIHFYISIYLTAENHFKPSDRAEPASTTGCENQATIYIPADRLSDLHVRVYRGGGGHRHRVHPPHPGPAVRQSHNVQLQRHLLHIHLHVILHGYSDRRAVHRLGGQGGGETQQEAGVVRPHSAAIV